MRDRHLFLIALVALTVTVPACTIRASLKQTTDTTSNITASTSGRSWFTGEGLVKEDFKMTAFVHLNFDNVKHDMAVGHGEYLASLATLMRIPAHEQPGFFRTIQARYAALVLSPMTEPAAMLTTLRQESAAHAVASAAP